MAILHIEKRLIAILKKVAILCNTIGSNPIYWFRNFKRKFMSTVGFEYYPLSGIEHYVPLKLGKYNIGAHYRSLIKIKHINS